MHAKTLNRNWRFLCPAAAMPFAELPALEVDGQTIVQSLAIARFIAKKHGLAGNGDMEAAKADMIVDGCSDFINKGGIVSGTGQGSLVYVNPARASSRNVGPAPRPFVT